MYAHVSKGNKQVFRIRGILKAEIIKINNYVQIKSVTNLKWRIIRHSQTYILTNKQ